GSLERRLAELERAAEEADLAGDTDAFAFRMRLLHEGPAEPRRAYLGRSSVLLVELRLGHELSGRGPPLRDMTEHGDRGLSRLRDKTPQRDGLGEVIEPRREGPGQMGDSLVGLAVVRVGGLGAGGVGARDRWVQLAITL